MCAALLQAIPSGHFQVVIPYPLHHPPASDGPAFTAFSVAQATAHTDRQLPWERHYLDLAAGVTPRGFAGQAPAGGCLIFWLPAESTKYPKGQGLGPYAQDTRGELGEWRGHMTHLRGLRVVVGGEEGFPGLDTITRNFQYALGEGFAVHRTLAATAAAAVELAERSQSNYKCVGGPQPYLQATAAEDRAAVQGKDIVRVIVLCCDGGPPPAARFYLLGKKDVTVTPGLQLSDFLSGIGGLDDENMSGFCSDFQDLMRGHGREGLEGLAGRCMYTRYIPK